jgi:hypothetical protein
MKFALLVALATVVVAVSAYSTPTINSVVYKPGEEYVYHYKGQVLNGIPKASKQYAGLVIDTIVRLQFQQDQRVHMKLEKVKLFKINEKISSKPDEILSEKDLTRLTGEQEEVITEFLVKPMKFRYQEGEVRDIEKDSRDRFWSVNIKKGILSLFQITLKERSTSVPEYSSSSSSSFSVDPMSSRIRPGSRTTSLVNPWRPSNKVNSVYKVMESDVTGDCENKYTVITDKTHSSTSTSKMFVTVVRNFDSCTSRPFVIKGLFQGTYRYPAEKNLIQHMVHTDYVITGDRSHFLIKEATLHGKYFFMPHGLDSGDMSSFIVQHLKLKSTDSIRTPIHVSNAKPESRGLHMILPEVSLTSSNKKFEEEPVRSSMFESRRRHTYKTLKEYESNDEDEEEMTTGDKTELMTVAEKKLTELVECIYSPEDTKCSILLLELSRIIRRADKEQLKSFIEPFVRSSSEKTSDTDYRKKEILLDLLPTLTTPESAKVLLELVKEENSISEIRGALMIKAMSLIVKPTPSVIRHTMELFKEQQKDRHATTLSGRTMLRQATLLSVGTMTHRLINVMRSHHKPIPEVITFIDSISGELKRMLEETSSESEKILVLKTMGNMGASETIYTLKNIIEERRLPLKIRINAVFALRRLAKQLTKQVVPVLLGVFMDIKEAHELRQAAFVVIINANPSFTTLQMIAHRLRDESSHQIRSLVYTHLVNLALYTSHEPEHKELSKSARLILTKIPSVYVGVHDTMSMLLSKFSEDLDLGVSMNLLKIKSKNSGLPEAIIANLQATFFGKHRRVLELGGEGKALEVILRKIFGPHGLLKEIIKGNVSLRDFIKPLTRPDMGGVDSKIREILNKMMMELRSDEEPLYTSYMHVLGNELQYIVLNSENVEEAVNKITRVLPELFSKLLRGIKVDVLKTLSSIESLTIASPIGMPLSINVTTMGIFKVHGHVKVEGMPTWSELISRRLPSPLPKIKFLFKLTPTVDISHFVTIGVNMRWLAAAVGVEGHFRTDVPTKFDVHINLPKHSLSVKLYTNKKEVTMHLKSKPITFIKYYPTTVDKLPYVIEAEEVVNEDIIKVTPFEYTFACPVTTTDVEVRGTYSVCGPSWCPSMPLFGKNSIVITAKPTSSVEYMHLKIKSLKSNFDLEAVPASRSTEELFEDDNTEEEETSEETEEDEDENTEDDEEDTRYTTPKPRRNYRTSSRSLPETTSTEFESITPDSIFSQEPMKRQLLITLVPNTGATPKIRTLVTWFMGRRYIKHQLNVQVIRKSHENMPVWKVKLNAVVDPESWYPEERTTETNLFLAKTRLTWTFGTHEQDIKIKLIPGSEINFSHEFREHDIVTADNLQRGKQQKIKYTVEVEVKHMGRTTLKYLTKLQDAIKYQFYDDLYTSIPRSPQQNKMIVAIEVLPWWEELSIIAKTPRENYYIADVPFYWNPFLPTNEKIRLHDLPVGVWYKNMTTDEVEENENEERDTVPYKTSPIYRDECSVSFDDEDVTIKTFDGAKLSANPLTSYYEKGCWVLLSQDCGQRDLFSISTSNTSESWKVKVLIPKYEIEMVDKDSEPEDVLSVKINGEHKRLHKTPIIVSDEDSREETSSKLIKLETLESGVFKLKAYELGLTIFMNNNKNKIYIKMSPTSALQGELCGLCGNNNQDQSDDFQIPTNHKVSSSRGVLLSNVIPSDTCDVDRIERPEEYCRKESHHMTIHREDNDERMTCRSEKKLPQCAEGCEPESTITKKICFSCRAEKSSKMQSRKPYSSRWDESRDREDETCGDFYQHVEIPTRCVPAY